MDAPFDVGLAKALSHPLRQQILLHLEGGEASPSELAAEFGEPVNSVAYHVAILRDHGCIELVRTAPRRGAVEHYYRAVVTTAVDDETWGALPRGVRRTLAGGTLTQIWSDLRSAFAAGALDRDDVHVARIALDLDDEGHREVAGILERAVLDCMAAQRRSLVRRARGTPGERPSLLAVLHVEMPREGPRVRRPDPVRG